MKAARAGHLCTVTFLLSRFSDVNRATANNDHTALSLACHGGHLHVVKVLLQHGANPHHILKVRPAQEGCVIYSRYGRHRGAEGREDLSQTQGTEGGGDLPYSHAIEEGGREGGTCHVGTQGRTEEGGVHHILKVRPGQE